MKDNDGDTGNGVNCQDVVAYIVRSPSAHLRPHSMEMTIYGHFVVVVTSSQLLHEGESPNTSHTGHMHSHAIMHILLALAMC